MAAGLLIVAVVVVIIDAGADHRAAARAIPVNHVAGRPANAASSSSIR